MTMQNIALTPSRRAAILRQTQSPRRKTIRWTAGKIILAAVLAAILTVTALAAVSPALREALSRALGSFTVQSQPITGVVSASDGIEVRPVAALSDKYLTRVYTEIQDTTGDRLSAEMRLSGGLYFTNGEEVSIGGGKIISYDKDTRTALAVFESTDTPLQDGESIELRLTELAPFATVRTPMPQNILTDKVLESFVPADLQAFGSSPSKNLYALRPGQTPHALSDTDIAALSSYGFAADGKLHLQLRLNGSAYADGSFPVLTTPRSRTTGEVIDGDMDMVCFTDNDVHYYEIIMAGMSRTEVSNIFIDSIYGGFAVKQKIEGDWQAGFTVKVPSSRSFAVNTQVGAAQVTKVEVSPLTLSVLAQSDSGVVFSNHPAYVLLRDGTKLVLTESSIRSGWSYDKSINRGRSIDRWMFDQPIDPANVVSINLDGVTIPLQ